MDRDMQKLFNELLSIDTANCQWAEFCRVAMAVMVDFLTPYILAASAADKRSGATLVQRALDQPLICYTLFRMYPEVFKHFVKCLAQDYGLLETQQVRHTEQVAIFLFTVAHGASQRLVAAIFDLSNCMVNEHFHRVLRSVTFLAASIIIQPHPAYRNGGGYHKPVHPRHEPFRDCIGAIDGTHIKCVAPHDKRDAYYNRKGYTSQNVLAISDFNLCFIFASPGWEGSMHDSRVLRECLQRFGDSFPHPGPRKYYLIDQGYPHKQGYMGPYRGKEIRYHFQQFDNAVSEEARNPRNREEAFNYLHSSCRNVIEHAFGVWKARFVILQCMPSYPMPTQAEVVLATMAIHNFLRINQSNDVAFNVACEQQHTLFEMDDSEPNGNEERPSTSRRGMREAWEQRRAAILDEIISAM